VDLRDLDAARLDHFETRLRQSAAEIGTATRTTFTVRKAVDSEPATSDSALMACVDRSAESLGLSRQPMPSGAGHDAQELARIAPMAMIFVPSVGGISHSPREFTKAEDVAHGVDVLLNAVVRADRL
jgi:N-carbamoyl-L-amino-acid hydrolase